MPDSCSSGVGDGVVPAWEMIASGIPGGITVTEGDDDCEGDGNGVGVGVEALR